ITADNQSKAYGDAVPTLTASYAGFVNGETSASLTTAPTLATAATAASPVNTYAITGSGAVDSNYTISYAPGILTVNKASLTITADNKTKTYGQSLTGGSGSTVFTPTGLRNAETVGTVTINYGTAAAANAAVNTYTGQVIPSSATGGTFTASNYNITYTTGDIIVGTAPLTITANNVNKIYGDVLVNETGSTAFTSTGLQNGETIGAVNLSYGTGEASTAAVATYSGQVKPGLAGGGTFVGGNYAITYANGDIIVGVKTIAVTATAQSKIYGDADPALAYTFTPALVAGDSFTGALSRAAGENTGSYAIGKNTLALSSNYALNYTGANLTIGTKTIAVTATAQSKIYGDADPALTYTFTPALVAGDSFSGALSRAAGENAGSYAIGKNTLALSNNYLLTYNTDNLVIGKKVLTVTAADKTKVYGTNNPVLTVIYTGFAGADNSSSLNTQPLATTTATAGTGAGTYAIIAAGGVSNNYVFNYVTGNLTITRALLTIKADDKSKTYGAAIPALTATYSGFVNNDGVSGLTTLPAIATTASTNSTSGNYPITASGAVSDNYTIAYVNGTLSINQVTLMVTVGNKTKGYGQPNPLLTVTYSGFVNGDTPANITTLPSITTAATPGSGAGTYAITAGGMVIPGYTFNYVPGTLTVTKAPLTISADNKAKLYGTANPVLTANYNGFVNGDNSANLTAQPIIATTVTNSTAPGSYPITVSGAAGYNYTVSYQPGALTVIALTNGAAVNMTISQGTLSPAFTVGINNYNIPVGYDVDYLKLTLTYDPTASATINGTAVPNGSPSYPIAVPAGTSTVTVIITAQDGTTKTIYTLSIYKATPPTAIIPTNILSPNGDGKNDNWIIKDIALYPNNVVTIYDRAGRAIYKKQGYNNDWSGTVNGAPLAQGTYYYVVELSPGITPIKGFITILRNNN
ncbi:MBG domain-containing protein, partial [Mucilaginibacter sp. UR6-11]|uniref:MBG domain-containing protein n=1 Tax=Mucilaginibacter sp. UR6-11 TaxID=1435644 RepID=UPI001E456821